MQYDAGDIAAARIAELEQQLADARRDGERLAELTREMIAAIRSEYPGTADSYQRGFDRIAARQKEGK